VHTVYVSAADADIDTPHRWGQAALELLDGAAADNTTAADVTGLGSMLSTAVYDRVRTKLTAQPVEDLRLDFEDGYGSRPDAEEDAAARSAAELLRELLAAPGGPVSAGVRFKSLEAATRRRGLRTLDLVLSEIAAGGAGLPSGFLVTLPKVTSVEQVRVMVQVCQELERAHGLRTGELRFEIQIETPQSILGADGTATVAAMIHTAGDRCIALHYGTFDYSAACGVAPDQQSLAHPVADHAKAVMQVAAAGTAVRVCDGSTNITPTGTPEQIRAAMRLHAQLVRRSLERAYYQGWDMHPGHLATRYLATYAFYRSGLPAAATRLSNYLTRQASGVMDEPATAQALAGFVVRGLHCGALDDTEVTTGTGVDRATLEALAQRRPLPAPSARPIEEDTPR
jgi:citrate lyase beta subunit